eukprot:9023055-Pyramimonas_sp.AAC.1
MTTCRIAWPPGRQNFVQTSALSTSSPTSTSPGRGRRCSCPPTRPRACQWSSSGPRPRCRPGTPFGSTPQTVPTARRRAPPLPPTGRGPTPAA